MALSDDLKALEELHSKGHLTDQEFTAAKTAAIGKATGTVAGSRYCAGLSAATRT